MNSVLQWKVEPVSPLSNEEVSLLDETLYESSFDDLKLQDENFEDCESKAEVASHILENLEKLVDLDELIKEEPSFLLDEKMLPLLDDVEPPRGAVAVPVTYHKHEDTQYYFGDLQYYTFNPGALTPPQSPPNITILEPIPQTPPPPDIARELAVVDELVRSTVEDMNWYQHQPPASPDSSSNSMFDDASSSDPEYVPQPSEKRARKPYGRVGDDRKIRKKEQNKNAATRYRMKKKQEVEVVFNEEKQLMDKQGQLKEEMVELQREIRCLKGLMRDMFRAKGLL